METFNELRRLAREKRDKAIKAARDHYQETLAEINGLQRTLIEPKPSLLGRPKPDVPLRVEIMDVAPKDSTFTVNDILRSLEFDEPEFTRVRTTFDRMIKRGDIKRIQRGRRNIPAVFAVSSYTAVSSGLNDLSQIEAAQVVLRELGRPVEFVVLVVEMLARGYKPVSSNAVFKKSLRAAMARKEHFSQTNMLWSCVKADQSLTGN